MNHLDCHVYYDSTRHPVPPVACGDRVDLAVDPAAEIRLLKLGISPRADLPAVLLTEPGGKIRIVGLRLSPDETARLATGTGVPSSRLLVYSSSWCGDCRRAKRVLEEAGALFEEVDVDRDAQAEAMILERSGGRRVVPTLKFDDRVWAFNPDPPLLRRLLNGAAQQGEIPS
ncbi:MAG TPA: glutaredoxin family protein [Thermoanaerobaculia bacterium]|nr:glutaredoxin family protein [Thermoanaerobaculia bacterium]